MVLTLDGDVFGFEENKKEDTISIELDGTCLTAECDFILGFGDEDAYFTMIFAQDKRAGTYEGDTAAVDNDTVHIYPAGSTSFANGNVVTLLNATVTSNLPSYKYSMWDAVAGGYGGNFQSLSNVMTWNEWPITLTVTQYDISGFVRVTLANGDRIVSKTVYDTFSTESDLYFAFTNDVSGAGEGFNISSITITWDMTQNYTDIPTAEPTASPTTEPTSPSPTVSKTTNSTTASLAFHCDNVGTVYLSHDGKESWSNVGSISHWPTPFMYEVTNISTDTVLRVSCLGTGSNEGFIATMQYGLRNYSTTNPLNDSFWRLINSTDGVTSPLVYSSKTASPWRISTPEIASDAYWVWNRNTVNTMLFEFAFDALITADNILLMKMESFQPLQNSTIGFIDILDEMHIEMDIVIHSFPSDWANIIHCTPDGNYPRLPGIWIHSNSATGRGFHVKFSNDDDANYGPSTGDTLIVAESYHFEMDITQSTHQVTVNGEVKVNETVATHDSYILENITCYASDPWYDAANVTISNLIIAGSCMSMCDAYYILEDCKWSPLKIQI